MPGEPSEEELRAAYEAELERLSTTDVLAQAVVSLLNIGARRLMPSAAGAAEGAAHADTSAEIGGGAALGGRDLDQARDAIDAVRALLEIIERRIPAPELRPLRDALSRLQMTYARETGPGAQPDVSAGAPPSAGQPSAGQAPAGGEGAAAESQSPSGPGPAEASGRLWVPGR
jgi:hypothetical protein